MEPGSSGPHPGGQTVETMLDRRLTTIESGNYGRNIETAVNDFLARVADGELPIEDVDVQLCRNYAVELHAAVGRGELASSTARTYFSNLRAFLTWCVRDGAIDANPADRERAEDPLPTTDADPDRQFWDRMTRKAFIRHMDREVDQTLDGDTKHDRLGIFRDRAFVYTIALSGVRGAEVLRDTSDELRNGLRWRDVDLERGVLTVLGKNREREPAQLPTPAVERLKRYRDELDPASDDWPVFPTLDTGSLRRQLDVGDDEAPFGAARRKGLTLPALSIQSGRNIVKKHSKTADLPPGDEEYLKLHGARRGLGDQLYGESAELAQEVLRHKSVETTHRAYREERTAQTREDVEDALDL